MTVEEAKEKLKQYLDYDYVYQRYKKDKKFKPNSIYDKECIEHCTAINIVLDHILDIETKTYQKLKNKEDEINSLRMSILSFSDEYKKSQVHNQQLKEVIKRLKG